MTKAKGQLTAGEAGILLVALLAQGIEPIVSGRWAIEAYFNEHPREETEEDRQWRTKYPPDGPLDLSCRFHDLPIIETVLGNHGFTLRHQLDFRRTFENDNEDIVNIYLFRPARDGGRIYPSLVQDQDWYYPPTTVSSGRLSSVAVQTEAPIDLDKARYATPQDEL